MSWENDPRIIEEEENLQSAINKGKENDPYAHYQRLISVSPWHAINTCRTLYGDESNFMK
jgi:hypothetical protein